MGRALLKKGNGVQHLAKYGLKTIEQPTNRSLESSNVQQLSHANFQIQCRWPQETHLA